MKRMSISRSKILFPAFAGLQNLHKKRASQIRGSYIDQVCFLYTDKTCFGHAGRIICEISQCSQDPVYEQPFPLPDNRIIGFSERSFSLFFVLICFKAAKGCQSFIICQIHNLFNSKLRMATYPLSCCSAGISSIKRWSSNSQLM